MRLRHLKLRDHRHATAWTLAGFLAVNTILIVQCVAVIHSTGLRAGAHEATLRLLAAVGCAYCVWAALLASHRVSPRGGPGFLIATAGLELRFLGDLLWTLPDPMGRYANSFSVITTEQALAPDQFGAIVATARTGGIVACVIGLAIVVAFGAVDYPARERRRTRRIGRASDWALWF
ncbi:MAG: hypothetical protein OER88_09085 [Planctomycetota bacterium]|nr:hypothetical protein [Planctomycetota bacterium]